MNHLSRPLGQRLGVPAATLLMAVGLVGSAFAQQQPGFVSLDSALTAAKIKKDSAKIKTFGNYNDCMDYKVSVGMHYCPGFILMIPTGIPYPAPCIDFDYSEPTASIEVTCSGESNVDGRANIGTILGGQQQKDKDQKCVVGIKTKGGQYSRRFYDVEVFSVTGPLSRLATSASPVQVAQTYTCGVLGLSGNMDLLKNLQNFNLDQFLNPSTWSGAAQSAVQNVQTPAGQLDFKSMFDFSQFNVGDMLTNLGESFKSAVTGFMAGLQASFTQLEAGLKGLMNGTTTATALGSQLDLGKMAQDFLGMGDAMGAKAAVTGDGDLLNAAIGATSAGNALQTLATGGTTKQQSASLGESIQVALSLGLQSLGLGGQKSASADTFYATNFTPAHFALSRQDVQEALDGLDQTQRQNGTSIVEGVQGGINNKYAEEQKADAKAQAKAKSAPGNRPNDAYASWSFIALGQQTADGVKPAGFVKDGQSQVALDAVLLNISTTLGWMDGVGKFMANQGLETVRHADAAELCSLQTQTQTTIRSLQAMKKRLTDTTSPTYLIPVGTYLNVSQPQVALRSEPVASCPLTHAGFRARADDPSRLEIVNCTSVCTGGGNTPRVCHIVPKAGFAGSCYTNALSVQRLEGEYLACNGQKPSRVANGMGGWTNVGKQYSSQLDENGKINRAYVGKLLAAGETALANLQTAKQAITAQIQARGGSCSALGNPVGQEFIAFTPLPSNAQTAGMAELGAAVGGSSAGPAVLGNALTTMTGTVDNMITLASMGPENLVASQVARIDPGVYPTVFKSDVMKGTVNLNQMSLGDEYMANPFAIGKFDIDHLINNTFKAIDNNNGLVMELAGCSSKLYGDIATDVVGVGTFDTTACWGDVDDGTGWSTHRMEPIAKFKVGAVGLRYAQATGAIPKDTSGRPVKFENEGINERSAATTEGLAPLGTAKATGSPNSKCYPEGTINPAVYTAGEQVVPSANEMLGAAIDSLKDDWTGKQTDTDDGSMVITYWKNTKCCIPPTCPQNIKQEF